jgi:decaprenyl-phosphate phosphoribosyltransferase
MIAPATQSTRSGMPAIVRLLRPRQWVKNVLVLAAPAGAGVLHRPDAMVETALAFVAFSMAASGTYCLNDAADVEADRAHPVKRHRPIANGSVSVPAARLLGVTLLLGAVAVALATAGWQLALVIAGYVTLTTAYTIWLKHIAVVDLAAVAAGFVIRAIAGAVATDVEVSDWFLIVASFGSLFMVAGKRSAELGEEGDVSSRRRVLSMYSPAYLTYVRSIASGMTLLAFTLLAFERADLSASPVPWYELSIIPFGLAILRYALLLDKGAGGAPEEVVLRDRTLQVLGLSFAVLAAIGVYTA